MDKPDKPLAKVIRDNDGLPEVLRRIDRSPTMRIAQAVKDIPALKVARQINELSVLRNPMVERFAEIQRNHDRVFGRLRGLQIPAIKLSLAEIESLKFQTSISKTLGMSRFATPSFEHITALSDRIAAIVEPHRRFMEGIGLWQAELSRKMQAITGLWAIPESVERSAFAFGQLTRFSDTLSFDAPYAPQTCEYVDEELGAVIEVVDGDDADVHEARYDAAGRNPALVAFPEPEYPNIIVAAGFMLEIPMPPVPQPIEHGDGLAVFDDAHHAALRALEMHMRNFVASRLADLSDWRWVKQRVPQEIRKRWEGRQAEDRERGQPVYAPIHYADFTDLEQIMMQAANWREAFATHFHNREALMVSLRRLAPLRNKNAHPRPMTQSDVLTLLAECTRLLRAMGVLRSFN